jgi:glutamate synthase domain-containing protein 3
VVEGTGDHGCEYMTGGTVVVLGRTGRNFAAGMSGGVAFVYDEDGHFARRCNTSMVALDKVLPADEQDPTTIHRGQADEVLLKALIEEHHRWTGSLRARHILDHWAESRAKFIKAFPHEYARALKQMNASVAADAALSKAKGGKAKAVAAK